jgi:hypothetical protein
VAVLGDLPARPAVLLVLRLVTWIARAAGYQRNPRPGYLDLRKQR